MARVFSSVPIIAPNGQKLSVVLAASNTKPRRAHFSVKHGTSGHKPLPMVKEDEETTPKIKVYSKSAQSTSPNKKISVYTDPSLYRTANIQPIAPAKLYVEEDKPLSVNCVILPFQPLLTLTDCDCLFSVDRFAVTLPTNQHQESGRRMAQ